MLLLINNNNPECTQVQERASLLLQEKIHHLMCLYHHYLQPSITGLVIIHTSLSCRIMFNRAYRL